MNYICAILLLMCGIAHGQLIEMYPPEIEIISYDTCERHGTKYEEGVHTIWASPSPCYQIRCYGHNQTEAVFCPIYCPIGMQIHLLQKGENKEFPACCPIYTCIETNIYFETK